MKKQFENLKHLQKFEFISVNFLSLTFFLYFVFFLIKSNFFLCIIITMILFVVGQVIIWIKKDLKIVLAFTPVVTAIILAIMGLYLAINM